MAKTPAPDLETLTAQIRIDGVDANASLEPAGTLRWTTTGGAGERCLNLEAEVLGFEVKGLQIVIKAFHGGEGGKGMNCCGGGVEKRARRDFALEFDSVESARQWSERLRSCFDLFGRPKRLFIFLNPFSGKKSGMKVFQTEIKPLLDAADIMYTVLETEYQLHAQEVAKSLDLLKYDGLVCVSGDGILVEVVNGILQREDWDSAITLPFGIIPAGTGNGIAKSLSHAVGDVNSVSNATFAIIKGHRRSLDVATIRQRDVKFFSVLMLTWGLIADIDIESEKYRWMGSARLDFYAFLRLLKLRKYDGRIQFVPAPGYETFGEPLKISDSLSGNFEHKQGKDAGDNEHKSSGYPGPICSFERSEWRYIDGPFVLVWFNNVPWSSEDVMQAPKAEFADGYLDAVIVRECPRLALLSMMLSFGDGSYIKSSYVTYLKVKAMCLEPGKRVGHATKGGIIDADGEVIARGDQSDGNLKVPMEYGHPIQMAVAKGLATIFCPI